MQSLIKTLIIFAVSLSMMIGSVALVGCGSSSAQATSTSEASASAQSDKASASEEQDDCYGDDLPVTKSDKS